MIVEAKALDLANGNKLWQEALKKEMHEVGVAFQILHDIKHISAGYSKTSEHIIFNVKMNLTLKERWVKHVHLTPDLDGSKYESVVSREIVWIAFTYAALHGIEVLAADIRNAYLQAPTSEKHYIMCGEFGLENVGKRALIV